jgi:hypothetical protein
MTDLWFAGDSTGWLDALPLGNGRLGAMVEAEGSATTLQVNDGSFWTGGLAGGLTGLAGGLTGLAGEPAATGPELSADAAAAALAAARDLIEAGSFAEAERELAGFGPTDSASYLPFVSVHLELPAGHSVQERRLDLAQAVHLVRGHLGAEPPAEAPAAAPDAAHSPAGAPPAELRPAEVRPAEVRPAEVPPGELLQTTFVSAPAGVLVHRLENSRGTGAVGISLSTPVPELGDARDQPSDPARPAVLAVDIEAPPRCGTTAGSILPHRRTSCASWMPR